MKSDSYYVYITTNDKRHTVLYVGITNNLLRRTWQHKQKFFRGFTSRYNVDKLIYYELFGSPLDAIAREKQIKRWSRQKKEELINTMNPEWRNLEEDL